eukprot:COSAG02_NODE_26119_length_640_cov_1.179298_1_plen_67_part_10
MTPVLRRACSGAERFAKSPVYLHLRPSRTLVDQMQTASSGRLRQDHGKEPKKDPAWAQFKRADAHVN